MQAKHGTLRVWVDMASADFADLNEKLNDCLRLCAQGDKRAFSTVYELTAPKFTAILSAQLRDSEAVRDVMQQAYLSIWRNAGKFDPAKGHAFTWMLVIMRNRGLDHLRKRARAPETEEVPAAMADEAPGPEHEARNSHIAHVVSGELRKLPQQVAMSITLNVVHGMSCSEIGKALDVSPNTVKGWIRRGLQKVRDGMPVSSVSAIL